MEATELNARIAALTGVDMLRLTADIAEAGGRYLKQKAKVEYMDDLRKVVLAELMEAQRHAFAEAGETKVSETRLETIARTQPKYREFLLRQRKEKSLLAELEVYYYGLRNKLEVVQAQLSHNKAEMFLERG